LVLVDLDRLDRDQAAELLLERALDEVLRRGDQLGAARLEDKPEQAASEVGAHDALSGRGEEHLLDQVAQVVIGAGRRGSPAPVDVVREVDVARHVASTRTCAETGSIGVPVGMHVDAPVIVARGTPPASTRTAPLIHWPVTHGGAPVPVSAQPVTEYGDAIVTAGWPDSSTRGNGESGVAGPGC